MEGRSGFGVDFVKDGLAYEISVVSGDAGITVLAAFDLDQTPRYAFLNVVLNASW